MSVCTRTRRQFLHSALGLAGLGLLTSCGMPPLLTQPARVPRIGYLARNDWPALRIQGFKEGLREHGYVEGENMLIEWRSAERTDQLRELAAELVGLKVDLIVAAGTPAIQAANEATSTIPIIMATSGDPVASRLIPSFARPGGNVTGLASLSIGLSVKRFDLMKEALPGITRIGVFWDPSSADKQNDFRETAGAAGAAGVEVRPLYVEAAADLEQAAEVIRTWHPDALVTLLDGLVREVSDLALSARLPSICEGRGFVLAGGMMSYGPNPVSWSGHAATYIDKILKGAKPADLPVEQPTTFEFWVNLKTASELGITIPQSVLQQATEAVQ
jgi:putative tryptophan/tyrosine transport system substrate-binding protein